MRWIGGLLGAMLALTSASGDGCEGPCRTPAGEYRIEFPVNGKARGVLVFFHGYNGSAEAQMQHRELVDVALRGGFAFAAPDGLNKSWSYPGSPSRSRDEFRFAASVLDDLKTRFGFGPETTIVGGYSAGASMAWYTLCRYGDRVAGAVTFSGVFWAPLPTADECAAPIPPLVHFHGKADTTFPLAGRAIRDRWRQGDTFVSMKFLRQQGACKPAPERAIGGLACDVSQCARGEIALCLHEGGHEISAAHLDAGLAEIERRLP